MKHSESKPGRKPNRRKVMVTVGLTPLQAQRLEHICIATGESMATHVRAAMDIYLDQIEDRLSARGMLPRIPRFPGNNVGFIQLEVGSN